MPVARISILLLLTNVMALTGSTQSRESTTGFLDRTITLDKAYSYKVFVPENWSKKKKWPMILFLHGAGERGDDNMAQTAVGLGPAIRRQQNEFPFVVVMPQCLKNRWWTEPEMQAVALKALDQSIKEFNGDTNRVYLTGLSMGGYGTWAIAANNPKKFAALAPICGGVVRPPRVPIPQETVVPNATGDPYETAAKKIGKSPAWVFHGAADPVVPVTESRKMVEALRAAGGDIRYSEYEGVGHNSWDKAYSEPEFFSWLLAHQSSRSKSKAR